MIPSKYREFLLQNLPEAKPASGFSEVVCKCFYCADDGDHHHMYVSVPQTENEPSLFFVLAGALPFFPNLLVILVR